MANRFMKNKKECSHKRVYFAELTINYNRIIRNSLNLYRIKNSFIYTLTIFHPSFCNPSLISLFIESFGIAIQTNPLALDNATY